jgi:membrane-associated phospholipid phosphatase
MEALQWLDLTLFQWMTAWHPRWLDGPMRGISASGSAGLVWLVLAAIGWMMPRHRAAAWRVALTVGLCYLLVDAVVKPLAGRERPSVLAIDPARALPPMPRTSSFPSGHAASTFGAAVAVSRMWPHGRVLWSTMALLIGYSRVYLGHHYPLDVVGGALMGIAIAFWVLGGRHPATYASTLPRPLPEGVVIRP